MVGMLRQPRLYESVLAHHLNSYRQMAFVAGPRQVGKTTVCRDLGDVYLDWDNEDHREVILRGPGAVAERTGLGRLSERPVVLVLDELHKYRRWKLFLKGFFDTYGDQTRVIVTGSSRLDTYRSGGDSLMGRYFLFRMHPLSVGEIARSERPATLIRKPTPVSDEDWQALWHHGGFPEPFVLRDDAFTLRWHQLRRGQLLKEDIRDLSRVQELDQLAILGRMLSDRSGQQLVYSTLARQIRVSENTVRSWVNTLRSLYYGFVLRPWYRNVSRSLRKEPKWYLRDWSSINDPGARAETFCACHLLKAAQSWTDLGLGVFELRYIRDKERREVDFLVLRDDKPWFLVEVKSSQSFLSPALEIFQRQTGAAHAFQVVLSEDYVDADCFAETDPVIVPGRTLFSQLP
jgi:predicted AAA+ superfamily ATPase